MPVLAAAGVSRREKKVRLGPHAPRSGPARERGRWHTSPVYRGRGATSPICASLPVGARVPPAPSIGARGPQPPNACAHPLGHVCPRPRLPGHGCHEAPLTTVTRLSVRTQSPLPGRIRVSGRKRCIIVHQKLPEARILPDVPIPGGSRGGSAPSATAATPCRSDARHNLDDQPAGRPGRGRVGVTPSTGPGAHAPHPGTRKATLGRETREWPLTHSGWILALRSALPDRRTCATHPG
jgi:hypothetical protein